MAVGYLLDVVEDPVDDFLVVLEHGGGFSTMGAGRRGRFEYSNIEWRTVDD